MHNLTIHGCEINYISSGVYAVGILLVAFATLTILLSFSANRRKELLLSFLTVKSFLCPYGNPFPL